jgi:hypothetical protein
MENPMKKLMILLATLLIAALAAPAQTPAVYAFNGASLARIKSLDPAKKKELKEAYKKLLRDAEKSLAVGPFSVMTKSQTPESGDKHDYLSLARYFWPDPKKSDGLPYIQKDGETNPEIETITDNKNFDQLTKNTETLALAYYYSGEEKYAEKAATLLRGWFLDAATKMNPNLNFGQVVKGKPGGRSSGLIEMRGLTRIIDATGLLEGSKAWTADDKKGLHDWFAKYYDWLMTSPIGMKEARATNNHGTWVTAQISEIGLYIGKKDSAVAFLEEAKQKVIAQQIDPDGTMDRELARTRSLHYTVFNLDALFTLSEIAKAAGVDLWNYESKDGRSIRKALDWMLPYVNGEKKWEHEQIDDEKMEKNYPIFRHAACQFGDEKYFKAADAIAPENPEKDRSLLLYIKP